MKKYFLEELKNFALQTISFTVLAIGVILFVGLVATYPILLIPILLLGVLYGSWQRAKRIYEHDKKQDERKLSDLYLEIYSIAAVHKSVEKKGFDFFKKAFEEYCEKYPKDKDTIERYTKNYQKLKEMFKSLGVEVD